MKYLFLGIVLGIVAQAILLFFIISDRDKDHVDERTKELCREYAARDHEKEIAPERYKYLGKEFVDNYDWYTSCINHTRYPVAK